MKKTTPQDFSWDDLKTVISIGEYGNLSRAADMMGINHSTLFRRLDAIESSLSQVLFLRRRSQYVPTKAGAALIALGHRIKDDISDVLQNIKEDECGFSGEIRVTTSDALLQDYLNPLIASFIRINPHISFQVSTGNESVNLFDGGADIAFRATTEVPEHLSGLKVGSAFWAVYGLREHWENKRPDLATLSEHRWVSFSYDMSRLNAFLWIEKNIPEKNIIFRGDSVLSVASAMASGMGLGILPCMHGNQIDKLVRISPEVEGVGEDIWLLAHPDVRKSAKIREFMNHCMQYLSENRKKIFEQPF